jgi:hypothetical protein
MSTPSVIELMQQVNGTTFIAIDTVTDVKLTGGKKNPFQGRVTKVMHGANVQVFQNKNSNGYANMVNRRLEAEGSNATFELSPRAWGTRIPNSPIVEHKGEFYLEVIFVRAGHSEYCVDGIVTPSDQLEGLPVATVSEGGQGGLENKVIIRTFKISSIRRIQINKVEYQYE